MLGRLCERFDSATVHFDVGEDRRAGNIHVPDAVVHELEVPAALAAFDVDGDNALTEEVFAGPVAAIVIAGGKLDREIGEPERFVGGHLRPHAGVSGVLGGAVLPGVVTELTQARNRVKDPSTPSRPNVVSAHIALHVPPALWIRARLVRGAYDHDITGHQGRSMEPDGTAQRIDLLIEVSHEVDQAVDAELGRAASCLRDERYELIPGRDVQDAPFGAVAPVGKAAARVPARRGLTPRALVLAVHPDHLTRSGVEGDHGAARARGRVGNAPHHQRRRLKRVLRPGTQKVRFQPPGDLELLEVRGVDLVERRVAGGRKIGAVASPLVFSWRGARLGSRRWADPATGKRGEEKQQGRTSTHENDS